MTTAAFISRRSAIRAMHSQTGFTREECTAKVNALPRKVVGKREKVSAAAVRRLISEMSRVPEVPKVSFRPLRPEHLASAIR